MHKSNQLLNDPLGLFERSLSCSWLFHYKNSPSIKTEKQKIKLDWRTYLSENTKQQRTSLVFDGIPKRNKKKGFVSNFQYAKNTLCAMNTH